MFNEGNQIHNFMSSSGSETVINYGSGSDFLTSYGSGSTSQKVTVPTVPVPVPQHCQPDVSNLTKRPTHPLSFYSITGIGQIWSEISKVYLGSMCTAVQYFRTRNLPPPPHTHLGSYTRQLLIIQDRRHLFVTP